MMTFESFVEHVKNTVLDYLPDDFQNAEVRVEHVTKNNNLHLTGITILQPDVRVSPTIYLEGIYQSYGSGESDLDECMKRVAEIYLENMISKDEGLKLSEFMEYENVRGKIFPRLVSSENNDDYLKNIPYRLMDGLAVVYYFTISESNGECASVRIHNGIMEEWGATEEELHEVALENLKTNMEMEFCSMREVILDMAQGMDEEELPPDDLGMYVLTNKKRLFGSSMMLQPDVMDCVAERMGEFYILPSSVHEVILIKKNGESHMSLLELEEMVKSINQTEVAKEERLSDHVFLYDVKTKEIYQAQHEEEHRRLSAEAEGQSKDQEKPAMPRMHRGR